jgi:hypothetical protein
MLNAPQSQLGPVILTPESIPARSGVIGAEESTVEGGQDEGGTVEDAEKRLDPFPGMYRRHYGDCLYLPPPKLYHPRSFVLSSK